MSGVNTNSSPYMQKPQVSYNLNGQPNSPSHLNANSNPPQPSHVGNKQLPIGHMPVSQGGPTIMPQRILPSSMTTTGASNFVRPLDVPQKAVITNTSINGQDINYAHFKTSAVTTSYGNMPPINTRSQVNSTNQLNQMPPINTRSQVNSPNQVNQNANSNMPQPMTFPSQSAHNSYPNQANFQTMQNKFTNMSVGGTIPTPQANYGNMSNSYAGSQPAVNNVSMNPGQNTNFLSNKIPPPNANIPPPLNVPVAGGIPATHPANTTVSSTFANRYPVPMQQPPSVTAAPRQNTMGQVAPYYTQQPGPYAQNNIVTSGFSQSWNKQHIDLLQTPNILPPTTVDPPRINLGDENLSNLNCRPNIIRCTLTKIPDNNSLLQKSRLPLGILIHPFKDLSHLPVIQCNVIVRCRSCRTYINPFVYFVDAKRWKCNICYRLNELPEEFQYDPVSKTYGDPSRRPEIRSSTIEYIAPAEYMLRPPQPAVYIFLLDISRLAVESGYLDVFCSVLIEELQKVPGDTRTQIALLAYDSALHFFLLSEGLSQPQEMIVVDVDEAFLPAPDGLLINLKDRMEMLVDVLEQLPEKYKNTFDTNSALGAALQVAHKMTSSTGGRITVFQSSLPNVGPGALTSREDPNQRSSAEVAHLNPANDFYKRLALECSSQQVAVDLFVLNSQYIDLATISGISRFSGGCIHHFPLFKSQQSQVTGFRNCLRRYLLRKIGFEAVMRVRCTRGLAVHTFHGNFFVRSTDLLSLPNINPDSAFGLQIAIEESLSDVQTVCFQAALLYTSSKAERRIRVHTLCLPITASLNDVIHSADQEAIIGLLAKMAVDRSMQSSLSDAREAFINVAVDVLASYKMSTNMGGSTELAVPECLKLLPLYISAILKHPAFRIGFPTRLDDRIKAMIDMKTKPLYLLIQQIYPDLYPIHNLEQTFTIPPEGEPIVYPPKLHLSARCLENKGAFLMDCGEHMMIWIGGSAPPEVVKMFGVDAYNSIPVPMTEIPELEYPPTQRLHQFISCLNDEKSYPATLQVIRDDKPDRVLFLEKLIEDRLENSMSYHEFLQHLKVQIK